MNKKEKINILCDSHPGFPREVLKEIVETWDSIKPSSIKYPFNSEVFMQMWGNWVEYKKKEHNFKFKSELSIQASLNKLTKLAEGDEETAIEIIVQSIENGWKGFFKIKTDSNGTRQEQGISDNFKRDIIEGLFSDTSN